MTVRERPGRLAGAAGLGERDIDGMIFTAELYGLQLDLLAVVLGQMEANCHIKYTVRYIQFRFSLCPAFVACILYFLSNT